MCAQARRNELLRGELITEDSVRAPGTDFLAECELRFLDREFGTQICALEKRCYSFPWSDAVLLAEFDKGISLRLGVTQGMRVRAYSFNYLVADELHILNLAVDPDFQRRGLGEFLLRNILRCGYERGARLATLEVRVSNQAGRRLYEKFGFQLAGRRPKYYRDTLEDALVLERRLG